MRLLREWLEQNVNKSYPFDTATIPTGLFTDMLLQVVGAPTGNVYVSNITAHDDKMAVYLAVGDKVGTVSMTEAIIIPKSSDNFQTTTFYCHSADNRIVSDGEITTGMADVLNNFNGSVDFDYDGGKVYDGCVIHADNIIHRLIVDNTVIPGDVELVAGDGIIITPEITETGSARIHIDVASYDLITENMNITSDRDLLLSIISTEGRPVTSINGVRPNMNGNIDLYSVDTDETNNEEAVKYKYITVTPVADGVLSLSVPGMVVCDTDISSYTQTTTDNIAALNERCAYLQSFCTSLETSLNFINTQLVQVK